MEPASDEDRSSQRPYQLSFLLKGANGVLEKDDVHVDFSDYSLSYYVEDYCHFAATVIQRRFRGYLVRKRLADQRWRACQAEAERQYEQLIEQIAVGVNAAATRIQNAWIGCRNRRLFRYYRNLIQFRERGDPRDLLKSINPREAELADPAAGLHIRFRLGGSTFPPLVFYKIFTHRTVTDICSFCPRDYTRDVSPTAADINNKSGARAQHHRPRCTAQRVELNDSPLREYIKLDGSIGYRSKDGWYERWDNNGWRPVADRLLAGEDPVTTLTRMKRLPVFHYNPMVRQEERAKRHKQKRREWLKKMYHLGLVGDGSAEQAGGAMKNDIKGADLDFTEGQDAALQEEASTQLLQWSEQLDYDRYVMDWVDTSCTLGSDAFTLLDQPSHGNDHVQDASLGGILAYNALLTSMGLKPRPFQASATAAGGFPVVIS